MVCPECGKNSKVLETREFGKLAFRRRRRECFGCKHRFSTYEVTYKPKKKSNPKELELALVLEKVEELKRFVTKNFGV